MNYPQKLKELAQKHKFLTAAAVITVLFGAYYFYSSSNQSQAATRYVLGAVKKDTLVTSISGNGQVSASSQVDVKAKASSGEATFVGVVAGQQVKSGALLVQLNAQDAQKAVRDAQANLDSAQLSLDKLVQPADQLAVTQAENSLTLARQAKAKGQDSLNAAYSDAFTNISNAFLDLPTVITGVQSALYGTSYNPQQDNISYYTDLAKVYDQTVFTYRDDANAKYQAARAAYDKNFLNYKAATRDSGNDAIDALLNETYNTFKLASNSVKSSDNFLSFVKDRLTARGTSLPLQMATHQANVATYTAKSNTNLSSISSSMDLIKNYKDTLVSDDLAITEKTQSLAKLKAGADPLDIQSQQLAVKQRQNALADAQQTLANYYIRAPFDGVIAKINVGKGDSVSSGFAAATVVTSQRIVVISLNEVDVARVKIGQRANLTFDAIDGLTLTGHVAQIDVTGTVAQGVVSYNVQIVLDAQDDRIKPGMSTSASVIIDAKPDVLVVPNGAVKTQGGQSYVEIADKSASQPVTGSANQVTLKMLPQAQAVEIGASNDTSTEITIGLKEGDTIIVQTITSGTTNTSPYQSSGLRIPGLSGAGGGGAANRAIRGN
ncbi:MAG: efflux RND transporter periplasmic adaptor subunit [Candidatus Portnoybacteria bacterium]|nr:efflux RND transporter periplasmic adaptor subunit [Candidatus Portnoybacteria bacterium]MDD4983029.1 efflux RND transporter periplasmic adaptor subunit [Candidatus Portnoybacteria bacterium]